MNEWTYFLALSLPTNMLVALMCRPLFWCSSLLAFECRNLHVLAAPAGIQLLFALGVEILWALYIIFPRKIKGIIHR
jgi:hypothetical protein